MKIEKFEKEKSNKYKVIIDGDKYILYDDIIVKYMLTMKKDISKNELDKIILENDELSFYYMAIKYLNIKMRSEKEIKEYLNKKDINKSAIDKTIKKLKENNFINEDIYLKAYINDKINLSNDGPLKIKKNLLKLGISEEKVNESINNIDNSIWSTKIKNIIEKDIKINHNKSSCMLKIKILNNLINQGYEKEMINDILNTYIIDDKDAYKHELEKITKSLSKKYEGYELERKIKEKLYKKGFKIGDYNEE